MDLKLPKKTKNILSSLAVAAVFLLAIILGISRGQTEAQAQIVVQTAQNTGRALQFFYQDQNRYPTVSEFGDQNTMLNYLSSFPLPDFVSKNCSQSFVYKQIGDQSFQLDFCLPTPASTYQAGWNVMNGSPAVNVNGG